MPRDPFFRWSRARVVRFMLRRLGAEAERIEYALVVSHSNHEYVMLRNRLTQIGEAVAAYIEEASVLSMRRRARRHQRIREKRAA